jgi:tRNA A-37 threonylcarbamoyl transferase component Bud32
MSGRNWDRVQELFLRAAELPAEARGAYLSENCAGDEDARREVESLLAAEQAADARLRSIVTAAALDVQTADAERAVGQRIGPYVIEKEIGRGGMGTVYLAFRDDDQFRQRVAIKVVNRGMDSEFGLSRFRRERQVLADLQHPNIARLLDGGATGDGLPFFAMEYLEGEPITAYCRRKELGLRARLELFLAVCSAVQYAHHMLVIHRDLKPGNILVGEDAIPKLLDFGVATLLDEHCEPAGVFSPITAKYASPEQLSGAKLTTATDVYSLGVILQELVEGKSPADGDPEIIAGKAMRPDADSRYSSVEELAADVRRYLEWRPVRARQGSPWYRVRKLARRRRLPLLAAAAVTCSLLAGMTEAFHQAGHAEAARRTADVERQRAEDRLTQILDFSNRSLTDVAALMERMPGALPARRELVSAMLGFLEKLSRDAGNDTALRVALAEAYLRLGELQGGSEAANLGDFPGAIQSFRAGAALLNRLPPATLAQSGGMGVWLDLTQNAARLMAERRERAGAIALLNEALAVSQAAPAAGRAVERSKAGLYLALARATYDDYSRSFAFAISYRQQLESLLARFPGDPDLRYDLSAAHTLIGFDCIQHGHPEDAVEPYQKSMQLREQLAREFPKDGVYRRALMLAYEHFAGLQGSPLAPNLGHTAVARTYYGKALPMAEEAARDPQNSVASANYAALLMRSAALAVPPEGLAESLATLRRAAALFESLKATGGGDVYSTLEATAHLYMGHRLTALADYSEALRQYQRAAGILEDLFFRHPQEWDVLRLDLEAESGMARVSVLTRHREEALTHAGRMLQKVEDATRRGAGGAFADSSTAQAYLALALAHRGFEEWAATREAGHRAIERATPLVTGRTWDPMARVVQDAQTLLAECEGHGN